MVLCTALGLGVWGREVVPCFLWGWATAPARLSPGNVSKTDGNIQEGKSAKQREHGWKDEGALKEGLILFPSMWECGWRRHTEIWFQQFSSRVLWCSTRGLPVCCPSCAQAISKILNDSTISGSQKPTLLVSRETAWFRLLPLGLLPVRT